MIQGNYIMVREFCAHHHLSVDFMQKLEERGMIEISRIEAEDYLAVTAISHLENTQITYNFFDTTQAGNG